MGTHASALVETLDELQEILDECAVTTWAIWLRRLRRSINDGNRGALGEFLAAEHGMGSFGDLYICGENGHRIMPGDVRTTNRRLDLLRSKAFVLAKEARIDAEA